MAAEQQPKRVKRIVAYIPENQHRLLHAKLAMKGKKIAEWVREKAQEEIDKQD